MRLYQLEPTRTTSPHPPHTRLSQLNAKSRVQSTDHIHHIQQKRAQPTSKQPLKADFTLTGSAGTDDDEWVSSESGAATPVDDSDDSEERGGTPVERRKVGPADHVAAATPRAEPALKRVETALKRVETARPTIQQFEQAPAPLAPIARPSVQQFEETSVTHDQIAQPSVQQVEQTSAPRIHTAPASSLELLGASPVRETRSAAPSPPRELRHPSTKRHSLIHQAPAGSDARFEMPPHPLIRRGQSYHGVLKPSPLAPLTVNSEAAQAQISSSPPSARSGRATPSPTHMLTPASLHSSSQTSTGSRQSLRRTSISSAHSVATMPVSSQSARALGSRTPRGDRTRTLSTISVSSSSAALSSLNALPAMSRPGTPPLTSHFPVDNPNNHNSDGLHALLPPPYVAAHLTVLAYHNPLRECYNRVMSARPRR